MNGMWIGSGLDIFWKKLRFRMVEKVAEYQYGRLVKGCQGGGLCSLESIVGVGRKNWTFRDDTQLSEAWNLFFCRAINRFGVEDVSKIVNRCL